MLWFTYIFVQFEVLVTFDSKSKIAVLMRTSHCVWHRWNVYLFPIFFIWLFNMYHIWRCFCASTFEHFLFFPFFYIHIMFYCIVNERYLVFYISDECLQFTITWAICIYRFIDLKIFFYLYIIFPFMTENCKVKTYRWR